MDGSFRFAVCLLLPWTYQHAPHYHRIMSLTQLTEKQCLLPWVLSVKYTWTVITLWLSPKAAFAQFLYSLQYFQLVQQHIWADSQDLVPKAWGVSRCITPGSLPKWHHAFLGFKQPQNELLLAVLAYSLGSPSSWSCPLVILSTMSPLQTHELQVWRWLITSVLCPLLKWYKNEIRPLWYY